MEIINLKPAACMINIPLPDKIKKQDINKYQIKFQEISKIIDEYNTVGLKVLIFCISGICKSPAVIVYLEMRKNNDILTILKKLKKKNSWICLNKNYLQFLLTNCKFTSS
jgi:protein-tyrosine phosphatase